MGVEALTLLAAIPKRGARASLRIPALFAECTPRLVESAVQEIYELLVQTQGCHVTVT